MKLGNLARLARTVGGLAALSLAVLAGPAIADDLAPDAAAVPAVEFQVAQEETAPAPEAPAAAPAAEAPAAAPAAEAAPAADATKTPDDNIS